MLLKYYVLPIKFERYIVVAIIQISTSRGKGQVRRCNVTMLIIV